MENVLYGTVLHSWEQFFFFPQGVLRELGGLEEL